MNYSEFKKIFAKHEWSKRWYKAIPVWICLNVFLGMLLFIVGSAIREVRRNPRYSPEKYRKVVKEGLFWDSVEWHER